MLEKSPYKKWLEKNKNSIPFYDIIEENNDLYNYILKEWKTIEKKNPKVGKLSCIENLLMVNDSFTQARRPIKADENRVEIATLLFENIINSLKNLNDHNLSKLLSSNYVNSIGNEILLLKADYWAKNHQEKDFDYYKGIKPLIDDFVLIHRKISKLFDSHSVNSKMPKWFVVGLKFADGTIQKKLSEHQNNATKVSTDIFGDKSFRPYISQTKANTVKDRLNIYNDLKKMEKILIHCKDNHISICDDFLSAHKELKCRTL